MALTENLYVGDGSTVLYSFTFPYIEEADVKVSLDQLNTTAFTLANATTVEFTTAPAHGVSIRVYRETPTDTISSVFFPGSAIRAQDLNDNFEQTLYVVQESQSIIENSDAASVVGIANQALSTANQASATANAVSGTANAALTLATDADVTANQALTDAGVANSSANAARVVADAALNPGSVISDLSDVAVVAPTTNQVLAWSGSEWSPVDQTGGSGGGGGGSGSAAWGKVAADGTINGGQNIAAVVTNTTGVYSVVFAIPMPNSNYSVVGTVADAGGSHANVNFQVTSQTASGFTAVTSVLKRDDGGIVYLSRGFNFQVDAINALPPTRGTGTDAWGSYNYFTGALDVSFNCVALKNSTGDFVVTFNTPMPTADYSVTASISNEVNAAIRVFNKSVNGFQVNTGNNGETFSSFVDANVDFQVHATNASIPYTVTQTQIESAVNNPGLSAWGTMAGDGTLLNGLNVTTSRIGTGKYQITFITPMPDGNYALTAGDTSGFDIATINRTATGCQLSVLSNGAFANSGVAFQVAATNGLPPKGGTGADAWGSVAALGAIEASFNVASVTRVGVGVYDVVFTTRMPTAAYAVIGSSNYLPSGVYYSFSANQKTTTGFRGYINRMNKDTGDNIPADSDLSFAVHATNATLPTTFSAAQIQSVLDFIAVANPAGVAKAWGSVTALGVIDASFNVASVTRAGTGLYDVVFTTPMPTANYAVTGNSNYLSSGTYWSFSANTKTTTGFRGYICRMDRVTGNIISVDSDLSFAVHANP